MLTTDLLDPRLREVTAVTVRRGDTGVFNVGGPRGGPVSSGHRYTLTISMAIRNLLKRNNPGPIIGNIGSPLFGQANQPYGVSTLVAPVSPNLPTVGGWNCKRGLPSIF